MRVMLSKSIVGTLLLCVAAAQVLAVEYRLETVEGLPEEVDASITSELNPRHLKLRTDGEEDLCEIWTTKSWTTVAEPAPTEKEADSDEEAAPVLLSLKPGTLIGVIRVDSPCVDLRDQEIPAGYYTLRYAVQPAFAAHRDTHDSRDFLLLISSATDKSPARIDDANRMISLSAESIQAQHPAFMPLVKPTMVDREELLRPDPRDPQGALLLLRGKDQDKHDVALEMIMLIWLAVG